MKILIATINDYFGILWGSYALYLAYKWCVSPTIPNCIEISYAAFAGIYLVAQFIVSPHSIGKEDEDFHKTIANSIACNMAYPAILIAMAFGLCAIQCNFL